MCKGDGDKVVVVVLVNAHLEVEAGELAQMAALLEFSARKLDPPRTRDPTIGRDRHLLVQLRRLREARRAPEVIGAEDLGPAFGLARDESLGEWISTKPRHEQCRARRDSQMLVATERHGRTRAGVGAYRERECTRPTGRA